MCYRLFSLLMLAVIALGISGCGGEGTSADPLGTDTLTLASSATTVNPNGTVVLTVTVTNASGTAVAGREVSFGLVTNASGASLTSPSIVSTSGTGVATILYRAGAIAGYDVVRASISSGAKMDVIITVGGGTGSNQIALEADNTSLTTGQTAILTATITNGSGDPVVGVVVTFAIAVNNTNATISPLNGGRTDAAGIAQAYYTPDYWAGSYQDTITASVAGASRVITITYTGTGGTSTTTVSVGASATSVTAGQVSIITATVTSTSGSTSTPASGITVTFTLPVNSSGATLSAATAVTDGDGNAVVTYQPGGTSPTLTVQDTVQAAVGTATSAVAITRVGSSTSAYSITVAALPTTLATDTSNSIVTANVKNNVGTVVSGVTVNFVVTGAVPLGTLSVASATTDGSGNAVTTFTGGGAHAIGDTNVVTATVNGTAYTSAVVITYP